MNRLLLLLLLASFSTQAANKYVRKGATGANTGADWANAYTELSSVSYSGLSGYTLYIAAGSYTTGLPYMNSLNNVTVKRATASDHGTDTGWNSSYDGVVIQESSGKFLYVNNCANFTFDGKGSDPWMFTVRGQNAVNGKFEIIDGSGITVRGLELDGLGCEPPIENGPEDGFRVIGPSNLIIEHCYVHNFYYCSYSGVSNPGHSDGIQMPSCNGAIIRYNRFQNCGMLLFFGDCAWGNQWANNVHVHHNVFIQEAGVAQNYRIMDMKGAGQTSADYVIIENNTFYRQSGFNGGTLYENTDCPANTTKRVIRNNIFFNGSFGLSSGWGSASNNCYYTGSTGPGVNNITSNPLFVNVAAFDFRLQSTSPAIGAGAPTTVTEDYAGVAIPAGSRPAMGAFQYGTPGPVTNPVISITPSSLDFGTVDSGTNKDLVISVRNVGAGTLTGSATVGSPFSVISGSYNLTSNQSQNVTIRYAPTASGSHSQIVNFSGGGGAAAVVGGTAISPLPGLSFNANAGVITAPFVAASDGTISQPSETTLTNGGQAVYSFFITNAGTYTIMANVNAPSEAANSVFIHIDGQPTDPDKIWDIPVTSGLQDRTASWRGTGTFDSPQYSPAVFNLSSGTHQLIVRGREGGVQLKKLSITPVAVSSPPQIPTGFRLDE